MESSYAQMMREEVRSTKIGTTIASFREVFGIYDSFVRITGIEEDLEDMRREEEEKKMKLAKKGGKRKWMPFWTFTKLHVIADIDNVLHWLSEE